MFTCANRGSSVEMQADQNFLSLTEEYFIGVRLVTLLQENIFFTLVE